MGYIGSNLEHTEGLVVWRIGGSMSSGNLDILRRDLASLLDSGKLQVILDLAGLEDIDSHGLGFLMKIQREIRFRSGRMVIIHLHAHFASLLELTCLNRALEIFLDRETAMRSFGDRHLKSI